MPSQALDARALARTKLRQRGLHVRKLRRTVLAIALALFVALWAVIFSQLVTGHDPVLSAKATSAATASTSSASGFASASGSGASASTSGSSSGASSSGAGVSPVTTRQS